MFNNISTSCMNFGYDAFMQSYPNIMYFFSIQAPHVNSTNFKLDMNITLTEYPSANRKKRI